MALLFMDSFDHYATADLTTKWTALNVAGASAAVTIGSTSGRRSTAGLQCTYSNSGSTTCNASKTLTPTGATVVVGCAFRTDLAPSATNGSGILAVYDGGTVQLTLVLLSDLRLQVKRGSVTGTTLGTSAGAALALNTFAYLEWQALIDPSAGTVDVRVNGAAVLTLTGQNTRASGASQWTSVQVGLQDSVNPGLISNECEYDDCYVCDGSGAAPWNTFLGDCRVDPRVPTGAGATTGWTPSTGANWSCVDEAAPNGDTDYTSAATAALTDTYVTQDAPVVGATIYGVQHCVNVEKTDAGACTVAPVIRHSGTDYPGADLSPSTSYAYGLQIAQVNPGTSAQWTESGFNAAEFGTGGPPEMAIALVASVTADPASTGGGTSTAIDTTGATLLLLGVAWWSGSGGTAAVSDSKSNTWVARTAYGPGGTNAKQQFFYCLTPTVGTGHTFTVTGTAVDPTFVVSALSGTSGATYQTESGTGATGFPTGPMASGSVTPSANGALIVSGIGATDVGGTFSVTPAGFSAVTTAGISGFNESIAYVVQSTAAAINPIWSWNATHGQIGIATVVFLVPVPPAAAVRVTQDVIELLSVPTPAARVTQYAVELLSQNLAVGPTGGARVDIYVWGPL